jgi:hypothetical protein
MKTCASLAALSTKPTRQLLDYLAASDPLVSSLFLALREIVLEEAPAAIESISMGYALAIGFSFTGKPLKDGFCHIVAYSSYVNLGFNRGALLADPNGVLAGNGKSIRHITIRNHDDLDRPLVRRYLQAAIEQVGGPSAQAAAKHSPKNSKSNPSPVARSRAQSVQIRKNKSSCHRE